LEAISGARGRDAHIAGLPAHTWRHMLALFPPIGRVGYFQQSK